MNKFLVVGLGNPGRKYESTRHNIGFMVIDQIAREHSLGFKGGFYSDYCVCDIEGKRVYLAKPQTYMNLSGKAVREIIDYFDIDTDCVIVVHDDLDLDFGKIKIRYGGSSGGHKGIDSIIAVLSTDKFIRVKMGIGKPKHKDISDYVLDDFSTDEKRLLEKFIELGVQAVNEILKNGLNKAMNLFSNKKITKEVNAQCQV